LPCGYEFQERGLEQIYSSRLLKQYNEGKLPILIFTFVNKQMFQGEL
jgi:hypothetical protein